MCAPSLPEQRFFAGTIDTLGRIISHLRGSMGLTIYGYVARGGGVYWGEIGDIKDLPLNLEDYVEPGCFKLTPGRRFRHSFVSPKHYLHPPRQVFVAESRGFEESRTDGRGDGGVALFGVKSCDIVAIGILDKFLLGKHPVYTARRRCVKFIVAEDCLEANSNCFCVSTGSGPVLNAGFDISYARLDDSTVLFRAGSPVGEEVLKASGVVAADGDAVSRYLESVNAVVEGMKRRMAVDAESVAERLRSLVGNEEFWRELSEECLGCGNCNFVCPTCFCIELDYEVGDNGHAAKTGVWTGCLLYSYGLVASGHFRRELYMRFRHFLLHKFLFAPRQTGRCGCTGCGRCVTWCPMGLGVKRAFERLTGVGGI